MENKWWNYYVVRYLVGTVVGASAIAFLNGHAGSPYKDLLSSFGEVKESPFAGVSLIAALGFAFCYVASAPVLTIHATRIHLRLSTLRAHWVKLGALVVGCIAGPIMASAYFLPIGVSAALGVTLGLQLFLLLCAITDSFKQIEGFYFAIAAKRALAAGKTAEPPGPEAEYVTSYRHLREHGNAFLILLLEAALVYVLYRLPSPTCALPILVVWILPASSAWLLGTVLEMRLAHKP
jgi:hypothetical protein